ncbi:MAG: ABC transporter ATP-binding protein [Deltaproteobacteria bacterium]|nr:ABC transporter ATP-binding protein [Deltaproteobacteria bacterium]
MTTPAPPRLDDSSLPVRVRGLLKRYGDRNVVDGIDLDVVHGETVGLLGPNGAGKTTTLEMIQGLTTPTAGSVRVLGLEQPRDREAVAARIGVALQETSLPDKLTALETITLFRSFYARGPDEATLLRDMHLEAHASTLVRALSGGERQRLALACALAGDPELVILDEPTTGLDPEARHRLWDRIEALADKGTTVLLTTHFMDEATRLCDRIVVIDRGRIIAEGAPETLVTAHVGSHVVELEITRGALSVEDAQAIVSVRVARLVGRTLRLGTDHADDVLARARELASTKEITLGRVAITPATLEDVFLVLAGRGLGEGEPR